MKAAARLWRYLRDYTGSLGLYLLFSLLATVFGAASIGMLAPVLNVLFRGEQLQPEKANAGFFEHWVYRFKAALLARDDWLPALLAPLVAAASADPWFQPGFRVMRDRLRIGALLADTGAVSITASISLTLSTLLWSPACHVKGL